MKKNTSIFSFATACKMHMITDYRNRALQGQKLTKKTKQNKNKSYCYTNYIIQCNCFLAHIMLFNNMTFQWPKSLQQNKNKTKKQCAQSEQI